MDDARCGPDFNNDGYVNGNDYGGGSADASAAMDEDAAVEDFAGYELRGLRQESVKIAIVLVRT
jgi:hypothetical protein